MDGSDIQDYLVDDLEAAYRRALKANEAVESVIGPDDVADAPAHDAASAPLPSPDPATCADGGEKASDSERIDVKRVIEAVLFVGNEPLTTKKLRRLFHGQVDRELIAEAIDSLNQEYSDSRSACEIRFGEGGYRMGLRPEFEKVRNRVYGVGPKEVRLSQEALEVLALVAYLQPVTKGDIESQGRSNPGAVLRQLLRRELIALQRDTDSPKDVTYGTTSRFLSLFGLSDIDELPRAEDLDVK